MSKKKVTEEVLDYVLRDLKLYIDSGQTDGGNNGGIDIKDAIEVTAEQEAAINKWVDKNGGAN